MPHPIIALTHQRLAQTLRLYVAIFVPMWLMFALDTSVLFGRWNALGIHPREFTLTNLVGIVGSWSMHTDLAQNIGNTWVMAQILVSSSALAIKVGAVGDFLNCFKHHTLSTWQAISQR